MICRNPVTEGELDQIIDFILLKFSLFSIVYANTVTNAIIFGSQSIPSIIKRTMLP